MSGSPESEDRTTIVAVHQGYELYGSDRTFISSLVGLRQAYPDAAIRVILPREGELAVVLRDMGFAVELQKLWVVRKANGALRMALNVLMFPFYMWRALGIMNASDVCYINTSVIFDYAIAARFSRAASFIHIHEIPTGPALRVVRAVLGFARAALIYNSVTTQKAFMPVTARSHTVVLNGVAVGEATAHRVAFSDPDGRVRILMIGRINAWKGQDLLVHALSIMPKAIAERLDVRFAGAAFEDGPAGRELALLVESKDLPCRVAFDGFVADPSTLYQWSDIVVVPSKKPEPFGLVAVEAMAHGRAVIAANHGGLTEIVVDGKTGIRFQPDSVSALTEAIARLVETPERTRAMGDEGRQRYRAAFTESRYQQELARLVGAALVDGRRGSSRLREVVQG